MAEIPIEPVVAAAETAANTIVTTAAQTAGTGLASAAQAGTAAVEGAVQTAGAAAETAGGAIPAAAEAAPEVVSTMVESSAQEGLAGGAEAVLETSGPEAALSGIASTDTVQASESQDQGNLPDHSSAEEPSDGAETNNRANPSEEPSAQEIEEKAPGSETPKVPGKVAGDVEFRRKWGELYAQAKQQGGEVDVSRIDKQALSEYYNDWAKTQVEQGLPDEIKNDPLYQQRLGEAAIAAQDKGETLDAKSLSREALSKYRQGKDLQEEQEVKPRGEELTSAEQRLQQLEQKVENLSLENAKLSSELDQAVASMAVIIPSVKELLETAQKQEQDPKKKETLVQLLAKLAAVMALSIFVEAGRDVVKK